MEKIILIADEGKMYTNGSAYGVEVYLAMGEDPTNWYQISEEEATTLFPDLIEDEIKEDG